MLDRVLKYCVLNCVLSHRPSVQKSVYWRWLYGLLLVSTLLPLSSCRTVLLQGLPGQSQEVSLQMAVAPSSERSRYVVSGTTNLPDSTPITVAAIRYFYPANSPNSSGSAATVAPGSTFTILDYVSTTVTKGKWQAELTLQEEGTDGKSWEAWQMQQSKLGLGLKPAETVSFVTTLTSLDQLTPLEQQLAEKGFRLPRGIVRSTVEGQRYAEVSQTIALAPPNAGQKAPAALEPHNYGWGDRYLLVQEPQNPTQLERPAEAQTNAPATAAEFIR